jgi:alkanesulfonate monooxygenase SsuD/methylene tetrahydromethanopterin reductase-like flavin-dependent oxidoreductase (luciferase family)
MTVCVDLGIPTYGVFPADAGTFFAELADIDDVRANGGSSGIDEPLEAWTVLAMMAARTARLRVGTEVTPLPLRQPVLLAQTVATLDVLTNGRAVLGLGGGWYRDEFERAGITFLPYRRRLEQTWEGAQTVRALLDGEAVSSSNGFYDLRDARVVARKNRSRVPLWFGGRSEHVLRLAAELGDGWITATNASPAEVEAGRERLHALVREAGRPADAVAIAVPFVARVAETTERARDDVEAYIARGAFEGFAKQFLEDATLAYGVWGSAEDCARKLEPYLDLGVGRVILDVRPPDHALDSARRICGELLPLLRTEVSR